ncbi:MAG: nuclease-like protein [Methylophaga sp.]|nr:MAG: nuclease-like protein [Methylophaga sp.]
MTIIRTIGCDTLLVEISINLIVAVCIICILLASLFYLRKKHKQSAAYQINMILAPEDEMQNFIIPDGIGGLLEVEHLILMEQGLLIIETFPISGNLFGAEKIDQWTQVIDKRSFKFINPLQHIHDTRQALKVLTPKIPIFCRVIFSADSHFPKGKPEEVSTLSSLAEDMQNMRALPKIIDSMRQEAWHQIIRIGRKDGQAILEAES